MAEEARRQGWRVVAFTFGEVPDLSPYAEPIIPSRVTEVEPVLTALARERVSAVLFSGKFWITDVLAARSPDAAHARITERAGSLVDASLTGVLVATLGEHGITVLDQRSFVGDWLTGPGCWSARAPEKMEWDDIYRGLPIARMLAEARIGQTVVLRRGAVAAAEALEGTTETIRRGGRLAGPGTIAVKAVARDHDYRFDTPTIGPETIEAAVAGGTTAVAIEANRVLILEKDLTVARADAGGIALVSVDDGCG